MLDENFFPNAKHFNGFRFVHPQKLPDSFRTVVQPEGPSRLVDMSPHYHNWGTGDIVW